MNGPDVLQLVRRQNFEAGLLLGLCFGQVLRRPGLTPRKPLLGLFLSHLPQILQRGFGLGHRGHRGHRQRPGRPLHHRGARRTQLRLAQKARGVPGSHAARGGIRHLALSEPHALYDTCLHNSSLFIIMTEIVRCLLPR